MAWGSKLQSVTALSTTEAEVIAAGATARVAIFLYMLLSDLQQSEGPARYPFRTTLLTFGDNQAALCLLKERRLTQQLIHLETIDLRLRQWVQAKRMAFDFVSTNENWADCLTKALPKLPLLKCLAGIGMSHSYGYEST